MLGRTISSIGSSLWFARAARTVHHLTAALMSSSSSSSSSSPSSSASSASSSSAWTRDHGAFTVTLVPLFSDNYAYVLMEKASRQCAWIDPADPSTVLTRWSAFQREHSEAAAADAATAPAPATPPTWTHILSTHKHWDHAGGNVDLVASVPHVQVVGGEHDKIPACTLPVADGQVVPFGSSLQIRALHVPCHTSGHVLYHVTSAVASSSSSATAAAPSDPGVLFTGDTLFVAGCGKFFEGTAKEMYRNLYDVMGALPEDTVTYCGHEYTVSNLQFARWVEPDNAAVSAKLEWATTQREQGLPTVGTTLREERQINPFLRVTEPHVQQRVAPFLATPAPAAASAPSDGGGGKGGERDGERQREQAIATLHAVREAKNRNAHA